MIGLRKIGQNNRFGVKNVDFFREKKPYLPPLPHFESEKKKTPIQVSIPKIRNIKLGTFNATLSKTSLGNYINRPQL